MLEEMADLLKNPMKIFTKPQKNGGNPPRIDDLVANRDYKSLSRMLENDDNAVLRCAAVMGLGEIGDKKALKAISKGLYDKDSLVRWTAGYELVKVDAPYAQLIIKQVFDNIEYQKFLVFCQEMDKTSSRNT